MLKPWIARSLFVLACCAQPLRSAPAQAAPRPARQGDAELKFVVILSRHGVRSPTGDASRYDRYSRAAWPAWDVPPGYLTPHGFALMKLFGAWDRSLLAGEGLLAPSGCADAGRVAIVADSDQRARESGRALAEGMFPACSPAVHAAPQGTRDPLFHPPHRGSSAVPAESAAAEARMEAAERSYTKQYRPQLAEMDHILATCGSPASPDHHRISLFDVPYAPRAGKRAHPGELRGPLSVAGGLSENFLLEYIQDMPLRDVGWGCVSEARLRSLMALHTAAFQYEHRNPVEARIAASNLLTAIHTAMEQAVQGKPLSGAPDRPEDRVLFLVGHDTNLATVAALLHVNWTADGRRDDTPPGSALEFDLWRSRWTGLYTIRLFFTTQTLDQMRDSTALTAAHPPVRVPLTLRACSEAEGDACSWTAFSRISRGAVAPASQDARVAEIRR